MPTDDAYFSGHLGLAYVLLLGPFFPELVMSIDLLSFEHISVLLFCFEPLFRLRTADNPCLNTCSFYLFDFLKNKTNHLMSSNSHPTSAEN